MESPEPSPPLPPVSPNAEPEKKTPALPPPAGIAKKPPVAAVPPPASTATGHRPGCDIKGNIGNGERIYHLPGGSHYGRTKIDADKGERWFCSEAEAEQAGWRKARN